MANQVEREKKVSHVYLFHFSHSVLNLLCLRPPDLESWWKTLSGTCPGAHTGTECLHIGIDSCKFGQNASELRDIIPMFC